MLPWILAAAVLIVIARMVRKQPRREQSTHDPANDAEPSDEEIQEIERKILDADALVQAYAAVLQVEDGPMLRPESELPASKARIKSALLVMAAYGKTRGSLTEERRITLRNAYSLLSTFVSEEAASRDAAIFAALAQWKRSATQTQEETIAAGRAIRDAVEAGKSNDVEGLDAVQLAQEFDARFSQMA